MSLGFWVQLVSLPHVQSHQDGSLRITDLNHLDFTFPILTMGDLNPSPSISLDSILNTIIGWYEQVDGTGCRVTPSCIDQIKAEILNSMMNQAHVYTYPPPLPRHIGESESIDWEQSLIEGDPVTPTNQLRYGIPPIGFIQEDHTHHGINFKYPIIHFFAVDRTRVTLTGKYEHLLDGLKLKLGVDGAEVVVVPVHQVQLPIIAQYFPYARRLDYTEIAHAQASLRTVFLPSLPSLNLKLSTGLVISQIRRDIPPKEILIGPTMNELVKRVSQGACADTDTQVLIIAHELGGVSVNHEDPDISALFACIIRQDPESLVRPMGEKAVICAGLTQRGPDGVFVINEILGLKGKDERVEFLSEYLDLYFRAFLPSILNYGFGFEAHGQNTLCRFRVDPQSGKWKLCGFVIRDFSGVVAHRDTLERGLRERVECMEGGGVYKWEESLDTAMCYMYRAHIELNLQSLIRALDLHYSGEGWRMVRKYLENILPRNSVLRERWLERENVEVKGSLRQRFANRATRDIVTVKLPNLILYQPPSESTQNSESC